MKEYLKIRPAIKEDVRWIKPLMVESWGGEPLVIRDGKKYYSSTLSLEGIIAENEQGIAGFLFYEIKDQNCEIIVFEVFDKFKGTGTKLLNELKTIAKNKNCQRLYLMTTNDNLDALRFYQCRGFKLCGLRIDGVEESRKHKPTIGFIGDYGIPLRDELDLELLI